MCSLAWAWEGREPVGPSASRTVGGLLARRRVRWTGIRTTGCRGLTGTGAACVSMPSTGNGLPVTGVFFARPALRADPRLWIELLAGRRRPTGRLALTQPTRSGSQRRSTCMATVVWHRRGTAGARGRTTCRRVSFAVAQQTDSSGIKAAGPRRRSPWSCARRTPRSSASACCGAASSWPARSKKGPGEAAPRPSEHGRAGKLRVPGLGRGQQHGVRSSGRE